jgi:hypothetical protein
MIIDKKGKKGFRWLNLIEIHWLHPFSMKLKTHILKTDCVYLWAHIIISNPLHSSIHNGCSFLSSSIYLLIIMRSHSFFSLSIKAFFSSHSIDSTRLLRQGILRLHVREELIEVHFIIIIFFFYIYVYIAIYFMEWFSHEIETFSSSTLACVLILFSSLFIRDIPTDLMNYI